MSESMSESMSVPMSVSDPHRELFELTRAFRLHLLGQQQAGRYGVVDGPTRRPDDVSREELMRANLGADSRNEPRPGEGPGERPGEGPGERNDRPPPAQPDGSRYGDVSPREALGFESMTDALAHLLGEDDARRPSRAARPEHPAPTPAPSPAAGPDVSAPTPAARPAPAGVDAPRLTLAEVRAQLGDCTRCKLSGTRTNIVFGVGADDAALMFIGEGPGEQEDRRGEPFVGPAGQLLDRMIAAMGWSRQTVYIANVVKCRPPDNRDPHPDEVAACEPFLAQQIASVKPRVIVTLGRPAAHLVLKTRAPIRQLRGRFQNYRGIPVMPTYHPAYLLRRPEEKRDTWQDLQQVIGALRNLGVTTPKPPRV